MVQKEMRVTRCVEHRAETSVVQIMKPNHGNSCRPNRVAVSFVGVFAALLFAFPVVRAQQSSDSPSAGNAQNGKKLFMSDGCYECHGRQGQGAAQTGAARIGPPLLTFEGFQSSVRQPTNQMPPYTSKAITDQDLGDIYAYLKSIPMPPKGKDIPLLNK